MQAEMLKEEQFAFVAKLARDLAGGEINLPSFPVVIMKIRDLLEDEECDFSQVSRVVSADAMLVSRLFVFANSAYHNQSDEKIVSLEMAIAKLGLKLVRNTALSIAVKQLMFSEKEPAIVAIVGKIWTSTMHLAAMSFAVAANSDEVDPENAFMCGLLHQVGKLYILTSAKDFPEFLGDAASLQHILEEWYQQVGRAIVESWGFPEEVSQSMDPSEFFEEHTHLEPAPVDIVMAAQGILRTEKANQSELFKQAVYRKLQIASEDLESISADYNEKLASVQQSLS